MQEKFRWVLFKISMSFTQLLKLIDEILTNAVLHNIQYFGFIQKYKYIPLNGKVKNIGENMMFNQTREGWEGDAGQTCTGQKCTAYELVRLVIYCDLKVHSLLWSIFWIRTCQYHILRSLHTQKNNFWKSEFRWKMYGRTSSYATFWDKSARRTSSYASIISMYYWFLAYVWHIFDIITWLWHFR